MGEKRKQAPEDRARVRRAVLRLREAGKTRPQIAEELGVTPGTVHSILHDLHDAGVVADRRLALRGPSGKRLDRWVQVLQLVRDGYLPRQMAVVLGVSRETLARDLVDLRDRRLLRGPNRRRWDVTHQCRCERTMELRQAGKPLGQIAQELGVSLATVGRDIATLRRRVAIGQGGSGRLPAGSLRERGRCNAQYTYGYDDLDRVTSVSNAGPPGVPNVVLSLGYDAAGR
ncbi:MAG: helix-turn-helix domain-containing protein, partial [Planctomycetes bacterium]|nr:helix-turn-helix domain-containing protein [Planctomycetota bacterium]